MGFRLGIDIGGTKVNMGVFQPDGSLISRRKMMVPRDKSCRNVLAGIAQETQAMLEKVNITKESIEFCGMGVPGTVNGMGSAVLSAPNLLWEMEPCSDIFNEIYGIKPILVQDSRAAALGEYLFGAGKGSRLLVCITLGTGVGAGIILNGEIFHGAMGGAGEVGHIPVVPEGRLCSCGRKGCMETYAAGKGIAMSAAQHPGFHPGITSQEVFALASEGNVDAQRIIGEAVNYLGQALTSVINILSPDALVFSGGMCTQRELYVEPIIEYIRSHAYSLSMRDGFFIGTAELGEDAPMIGAAMLNHSSRKEL